MPCAVIHIKIVNVLWTDSSIGKAVVQVTSYTQFATPVGVPMPVPPPTIVVTPDGDITINSTSPVQLIFNVDDDSYLFAGVAWKTDEEDEVSLQDAGGSTFPAVFIQREQHIVSAFTDPQEGGSYISIRDQADQAGSYNYTLLIQDSKTGSLAVYDPGMDNDPPA